MSSAVFRLQRHPLLWLPILPSIIATVSLRRVLCISLPETAYIIIGSNSVGDPTLIRHRSSESPLYSECFIRRWFSAELLFSAAPAMLVLSTRAAS